MFEPSWPLPTDSLVACSIHLKNSKQLYVNVLNTGDENLVLEEGKLIGNMSEAEEADAKFDEEVANFKPLSCFDLNSLVREIYDWKHKPPHVQRSIKDVLSLKAGKNLTEDQLARLRAVLLRNHAAFQWNPDQIGRTNLVEHKIPTGDNKPVQQRQYQIRSIAKEAVAGQVDEMLKNKIIRPINSEWRSPVLLVKKKSQEGPVQYRFRIDLKKVNEITTKDCYSLPRIGNTGEALSGSNYFAKMDVDRAFWQISIAEEDKKKTAFVIEGKLYEFETMPLGGINSPASFQRLMGRILSGLT